MLLNDIGRVPATTLRKINQHLESNYGFKITESAKDHDLVAIMETIQDEITSLKIQGADSKQSPEISKRLLVLEGLRTLREFAMQQFQSPKLDSVISGMVDFVVKTFHHTATGETGQADFEEAIKDAMKVYRSSPYRFPDSYIEDRVRQAAMAQINPTTESASPIGSEEEQVTEISDTLAKSYMSGAMHDTITGKKDRNPGMQKAVSRLAGTNKPLIATDEATVSRANSNWSNIGDRENAGSGHAPLDLSKQQQDAISKIAPPDLSVDDSTQVPMVRNPRTGQMQLDPFAANAAARRKGITMRENNNLVKHLRALLETEVSQAEVMMAAKGFAQELQEMVEKIGRLQNEDLPPVTDQMRETYGMSSASAFQTQIYGALQSVMDALYTAKGQVDDAVGNMASTGQVTASVDMDKDMGDEMDADMGPELDLDNIDDELGAEQGDEFGGAEGEEPLGRAMKTEAILSRKVLEMQKIVAKARKLKEARK